MASIALPMAAPGAASADTTFVLFEHDNQQNFVDNNDQGPGPGDQFLFAGDVFDRPGGVLLGTTAGICTTISGNETAGQTSCSATFNLAGGQIVVQGIGRHRSTARPGRRQPVGYHRWHRDLSGGQR